MESKGVRFSVRTFVFALVLLLVGAGFLVAGVVGLLLPAFRRLRY